MRLFDLVLAENAEAVRDLENTFGVVQSRVVDHFIEFTAWGDFIPEYKLLKGTDEERLLALRACHFAVSGYKRFAALQNSR